MHYHTIGGKKSQSHLQRNNSPSLIERLQGRHKAIVAEMFVCDTKCQLKCKPVCKHWQLVLC